jgi:hypothetical protein
MTDLEDLSKSISKRALPVSQVDASYHPFTPSDDPGTITVPSTRSAFRPKLDDKSDLYLWRQLLSLYIDAEVFDSVAERNRGERSLEDAELRMAKFLERAEKSGVLQGKSKKANVEVQRFFRLNNMILNLKKVSLRSRDSSND